MKIIISEKTEKQLIKLLMKESCEYLDKKELVITYLVGHYLAADYSNWNGSEVAKEAKFIPIDPTTKQPMSQDGEQVVLTKAELFDRLQTRFKGLCGSDKETRNSIIDEAISEWFNGLHKKSKSYRKKF